MLLVEMVGCPGIGKSTVCKTATEKLLSAGLRIGNLSDFFFRNRGHGNLKLVRNVFLDVKNYPLYFDSVLIKLNYGNNNGNWRYVGSLVFLLYQLIHVLPSKEFDVLLLDEGIVQYISSLMYLEKLPESFIHEPIYQHLKERKVEPILLFCDADIDENLRRLRNRNIRTRFSCIKEDDELKKVMGIKKHNLSRVAEGFTDVYHLNMNLAPSQNVDIVCQTVIHLHEASVRYRHCEAEKH